MTTDITELATVLRLAAESEIAYREEGDTSDLWQDEASPDNVLALVEALEKAQQQNKSDFEIKARLCKESNSLHDRLRVAEKRIAELESRTVTVKLPSLNPAMFNGDVMFGYHKAQKEAVEFCAAAGIKVEVE